MRSPCVFPLATLVTLAAVPAPLCGGVLVNLDATALPNGALANWPNSGSVVGNFNSVGSAVPQVTTVGGVKAVTFVGTTSFYSGPAVPVSIAGQTQTRSIEVWAYNPSFVGEETMVSWGRRGGPPGSNMAFNYGNNGQWGAVGHWDTPDLGWDPGTTSTTDGTAVPPAANQWHHLVYTYDGNTTRVYADGALRNSETVGQLNSHTTRTNGQPLLFVIGGQNDNNGNPIGFNATLSLARVRVHDVVLTPQEIENQFLTEGGTFGRGQPSITAFTATPPIFLPGQSVTLAWNVTTATSASIDQGIGPVSTGPGSLVIQPNAAATFTLTAGNINGSVTAQASITPAQPSQLVHRWNFNEPGGDDVFDIVGTAHGKIRGPTTGTGSWSRSNGGVVLSGGASTIASYIDLPNGILSSLNETTLEGWITVNGSQNWSRWFDFGSSTGGERQAPGGAGNGITYWMAGQSGGNVNLRRFEIRGAGAGNLLDVTDTLTLAQQFHFAAVYDAKGNGGAPQTRLYRNGALISTVNASVRLNQINDVNNWLGRSNFFADANLNGAFNEFRMWNGALSAAAIQDTAAAGPDALPQAPRIQTFAALPSATIYRGENVRLSLLVADPAGTGLTLSIDKGAPQPPGPSSFVTVSPIQNTTYTLTATGTGGTRTATASIVVLPGEPIAADGSITSGYQTATPVHLLATDPNTPLDQLTYFIVDPPDHGGLSGAGANRTYTPVNGYSGQDSFTFKASDGISDSNIATVTINVLPPPVPPTDIALSDDFLRTSDGLGNMVARLEAIDANPGDSFTFALVGGAGSTHNNHFLIDGNQLISQHDFANDLNQNISVRIRVSDLAGHAFERSFVLPVQAADLHVKINEIFYNPPRNTMAAEFVELYNPFGASVDVGGWRFDRGIEFTFPAGTSIPANGYLVVAQDPATILALYGVNALGPWSGGLDSDGDAIRLRDHTGAQVDEVEYGNNSPWPTSPNGDGPSLELIHPDLDNDLGGHWRASTPPPAGTLLIPAASVDWKFLPGTAEASAPVGAWRFSGFSEAGWTTGRAPVGLFKLNNNNPTASFAETGVTLNTQLTNPLMAAYVAGAGGAPGTYTLNYRSVYFRKSFSLAAPLPRALTLRVMHNDAAIVWLNGVEVARFGFIPTMQTGEVPFNETKYYESGNDPWSDTVILDASNLLTAGNNVLAIHGFAKAPQPRTGQTGFPGYGQEDLARYNNFDFCIDAELRVATEQGGTPGTQNSVFASNAPPAIRQVGHSPQQPTAADPIVVTARISDRQGLGSVQLAYQIVAPGNFIPATLPRTNAEILNNIVANRDYPRLPNPAFENPANWVTIPMTDNGGSMIETAGDGVFTGVIPPQPHRTLVRYRITATDRPGIAARAPAVDDSMMNFAYFVYDGVPDYTAGTQVFSAATLETLPVYHWITRPADFSRLLAYSAGDQFNNNSDLNVLLARRYYNFEGAMVYDGKVYDHVEVRLRGGNSRYMGAGKRHFRFNFPKGYAFAAKDNRGRPYPRDWEDMLFNKLFGNKGYYDWGLPYHVGAKLWEVQGTPMPFNHWVHFRVVRGAAEAPDPAGGDFWGLYQALEVPDGKNFLKARDLPPGNFYKMSDWMQSGEMNERYQVPGAPDFGEDFDNIRYNIHQAIPEAYIKTYIDMPRWYRYNAVQEAIRHYDIFVEPTGRHRVKNLLWYFMPKEGTNGLGQLIYMPYDWDASFGPNWNLGREFVNNAIYNYYQIPDSPTWGPMQNRTAMQIEHRNAIRELRDLVVYRDAGTGRGPVDDMLDDAVATVSAFWPADRARWPATGAQADHPGGAPYKAQDMKNFLFVGWTDPVGGDPAIGAGGRVTYLDSLGNAGTDSANLPATPTISYGGAVNYPVDGLAFTSSAFSDPQGAQTFNAIEWRIGEVTDPAAPAYDPTADRIYEAVAVWTSGPLATFNSSIQIPGNVLRSGHAYRARVRHQDQSGRWSRWSAPLSFTATDPNALPLLEANLVISEFIYKPAPPSPAEAAAGFGESDFEWIELRNISDTLTLDLTSVRFTKGVDFDFLGSTVTSLPPGGVALVVENPAAFEMRHGTGHPVAGTWDAGQNLANDGEQLKLSFGAGAGIRDFVFDDAAPWPVEADLGGVSLVLMSPEANPDHADPASWRAGYIAGGTPGTEEFTTLDRWMAANGQTDPNADPDGNGLVNVLEFALGNDLRPYSTTESIGEIGGQEFFVFTYTRRRGAEGVAYAHEISDNLITWDSSAGATQVLDITPNPDGTETVRVQVTSAVAARPWCFLRVRVTVF